MQALTSNPSHIIQRWAFPGSTDFAELLILSANPRWSPTWRNWGTVLHTLHATQHGETVPVLLSSLQSSAAQSIRAGLRPFNSHYS